MSLFAIGAPGDAARLIMRADTAEEAAEQLRAGEVAVPVSTPGAYTIAEDGMSAAQVRVTVDGLWHRVRCERFARLTASDDSQWGDRPMAPERKEAWEAYRQQLRDITTQTDPANITWPMPPS